MKRVGDIFWKYILTISSFGFLVPILFTTNPLFIVLFFTVSFASAMFWIDSVENSVFHTMDAAMARIGILSVLIYKLFINTNNLQLFLGMALVTFWFIYKSNVASRKKWAGKSHILFHLYSHLALIATGIVAFLPPLEV